MNIYFIAPWQADAAYRLMRFWRTRHYPFAVAPAYHRGLRAGGWFYLERPQ